MDVADIVITLAMTFIFIAVSVTAGIQFARLINDISRRD